MSSAGDDDPHRGGGVPRFGVLGQPWTLELMAVMARRGRIRYTELRAELPGISNALFSQRLKSLVAAGLLARHVSEGPPLLTSYAMTPAGRELADHALAMAELLDTHALSA